MLWGYEKANEAHMIDPEFHLVRLTAQSKRADPKHVPGGVPAWTAADVQALAGSIGDIFAYWAILAKFCQSDIATANLTDAIQRLSWQSWRDKPLNRDTAFSVDLSDRLAQAAVLCFICPRTSDGHLRGDEFVAAYIGRHRNTFAPRYKRHWQALLGKLHALESSGLEDLRRAQYHDQSD